MKRKILYLSNQFPFPTDSGGKVKTLGRLLVLAEYYQVDLVTLVDTNDSCDETNYNYGRIIYNKIPLISKRHPVKTALRMLKGLILGKSAILMRFWSSELKKKVDALLCENSYDFIIIGHLLMAQYIPENSIVKVIYDSDNVESKLWEERISNSNWFFRLILKKELRILKQSEQSLLATASQVIALTEKDKADFLELCPRIRIETIPIILPHVPRSWKARNDLKKMVLGFIGTLSWYPNSHGLNWLLENVIKRLDPSTGIKLAIIGGNAEKIIRITKSSNWILFNGRVDDIDTVYETIDVMIIPIWKGSGMAVKAIEALAAGVPIISTSFGMRGIKVQNGKDVLICDSEDEFIEAINYLKNHPTERLRLSNNAKELFYRDYSAEVLGNSYINILERLGA